MRTGIVYTETVIYSAPEAFTTDAPYQTAIVTLDALKEMGLVKGGSCTALIKASHVLVAVDG